MKKNLHILLVEDDQSLAQWVSEYLQEQGFEVSCIDHGDLVVAQVEKHPPDLVLLDVMLPGANGIAVCRELRKRWHFPIIMLTARSDEFDEVIGLEAGANDYIIKPVRPRALLARIESALRNISQAQQSDKLTFGDLEIDEQAKRVVYCGEEITLSSNLYAFFCFLANNAGQVVDRENVFQTLKNREYDGLDRRFDVMLSTLRKLFNDDPSNPKKLKTVWGKGYLFVADAWQKS